MSASTNSIAFDRAVAPVFRLLTREQTLQIADFHGDTELQDRIQILAEKANEGRLSDEERSEYEGYAQANKFIAVLKAKARRMLDPRTTP